MKVELGTLKIEKIEDAQDVSMFDNRIEEINTFLKSDALNEQNKFFSVTYLVKNNLTVVGYFTLASASLQVKKPSQRKEVLNGDEMELYPGILIGYLGVDKDHERMGIGPEMVRLIYYIAQKIRKEVGCRLLMLHANLETEGWWKKLHFRTFSDSKDRKLKWYWIDLQDMEP